MVTSISEHHASSIQHTLMRFYEELLRQKTDSLESSYSLDKSRANGSNYSENNEELNNSSNPERKPLSPNRTEPASGGNYDKAAQQNEQPFPQVEPSNEDRNQEEIPAVITVSKDSNPVYKAQVHKQGFQELTKDSELILGQIQVLQSFPSGTEVPGSSNLKVEIEVEGQHNTVFSTNEQGKITQNLISSPLTNSNQLNQVKGSDIVAQHLAKLDPNLAKYLTNQQEQIKLLQLTLEEILKDSKALNEQVNKVIKERKQESNNPRWWQQLDRGGKQKVGELRQGWEQIVISHRAATTVRDIFRREVSPKHSLYLGKDYQITKEHNQYILRDNQGQELLKFVENHGVIKLQNNRLTSEDFQQLELARTALKENQPLSGKLTPLEEDLRFFRSQQVAEKLLKISQKTGQDYWFSQGKQYDVSVSAKGQISISAKDGRGVIFSLSKVGEQVFTSNRLTSKDLQFFEQRLSQAKQKPHRQSVNQQISPPTPKVTPLPQPRRRGRGR